MKGFFARNGAWRIAFSACPVTVFSVPSKYLMFLPEGSRITLTLPGEEPLDLTDLMLDLLNAGELCSSLPPGGEPEGTSFGVLDFPDGSRFYRDGHRISSGLVVDLLTRAVTESLRRLLVASSSSPQRWR